MPSLRLLLALALTVLPALIWLGRLVPKGIAHRQLLIWGYALLLGMIGITLGMRLLSSMGIPLTLTSIGSVAALVALAGLLVPKYWRTSEVSAAARAAPLSRAQWIVIGICMALLLGRLVALGIEVGTKPMFAWDALQHWAKQAKVFYEQQSVVPYVTLEQWLALGGEGVYTNMHPDYPITTPLLQAWVGIALGSWHESLVNLPWLLVWLAIGLIFYAQSRQAGVEAATSLAATYIVLSLPYLNTHIALAGYADVVLALCFLAALCAFYNWSQGGQPWQAVLFLLCVLSGVLIKNEGVFWFIAFLPGLVLVCFGLKRGAVLLASGFIALLAFVAFAPGDWVLGGHNLENLELRYRPAGWRPVYLNFLVYSNWHFLTYLLIAALLASLLRLRDAPRVIAPVAAVLVSAFGLYICLYLFTRYSFGAVRMTSLNRVALQLMPAAAFFCLIVYSYLSREEPGREQTVINANSDYPDS